jgi:hypothetical protein
MTRSTVPVACLLVWSVAIAAPQHEPFCFEDAVRLSDRIVVGRVEGPNGAAVALPDGGQIVLGIKDPVTGVVFTAYRVQITECLFDKNDACQLESIEVDVPGGTIYERVNGEDRLRTWEVTGAAGAPLPPTGDDVLLFMTKSGGRYRPLNDVGARIRVERTPASSASVILRFASPRFLSAEGRESARERASAGNPATRRPVYVEAVSVDRLKALIVLARQVLKPTSGSRHAIPDRADPCAYDALRKRGTRVRAGEIPQRRESALGLGNDLASIHRPDDRGRACSS